MNKGGFLIGLILASVSFSQTQSARSLFMSTAGSEVIYKQEEKSAEQRQKSTQTTAKREGQPPKATVYYGMSVQVYAERNGKLVPVDPGQHTFRTGDRFRVKVLYNSPGIVEFVNIDPEGKENYLGQWVVEEAFTGTMLPAEGSFKFIGTKGREVLIVRFFPCRPEDRKMVNEINTASSRAITVVKDEEMRPASFSASVPACNMNNIPKVDSYRDYATASARGIMVVHEQVEKCTYYFVSQDSYQKEVKPITAVLELRHR